MPGARRRGRPRTVWIDNIKTWTGLPVEESIRMTEEINGESTSMVWPTLGSRTAKERYRTEQNIYSFSSCWVDGRNGRCKHGPETATKIWILKICWNSRILTNFKTANEFNFFLNSKISDVMFIQIATFWQLHELRFYVPLDTK